MNVNFFQEDNGVVSSAGVYRKPVKKYGFLSFIFDIIMVVITGGFWLIWIFAREMRKR